MIPSRARVAAPTGRPLSRGPRVAAQGVAPGAYPWMRILSAPPPPRARPRGGSKERPRLPLPARACATSWERGATSPGPLLRWIERSLRMGCAMTVRRGQPFHRGIAKGLLVPL